MEQGTLSPDLRQTKERFRHDQMILHNIRQVIKMQIFNRENPNRRESRCIDSSRLHNTHSSICLFLHLGSSMFSSNSPFSSSDKYIKGGFLITVLHALLCSKCLHSFWGSLDIQKWNGSLTDGLSTTFLENYLKPLNGN